MLKRNKRSFFSSLLLLGWCILFSFETKSSYVAHVGLQRMALCDLSLSFPPETSVCSLSDNPAGSWDTLEPSIVFSRSPETHTS